MLLFLSCSPYFLLKRIPHFLGHSLKSAKLSGALQPLTPVDRNDFSVDKACEIRKKECGQIGQFLMFPYPVEWDPFFEIELLGQLAREKTFGGSFCGKGTGCDGIVSDSLRAPLHGQRSGQ